MATLESESFFVQQEPNPWMNRTHKIGIFVFTKPEHWVLLELFKLVGLKSQRTIVATLNAVTEDHEHTEVILMLMKALRRNLIENQFEILKPLNILNEDYVDVITSKLQRIDQIMKVYDDPQQHELEPKNIIVSKSFQNNERVFVPSPVSPVPSRKRKHSESTDGSDGGTTILASDDDSSQDSFASAKQSLTNGEGSENEKYSLEVVLDDCEMTRKVVEHRSVPPSKTLPLKVVSKVHTNGPSIDQSHRLGTFVFTSSQFEELMQHLHKISSTTQFKILSLLTLSTRHTCIELVVFKIIEAMVVEQVRSEGKLHNKIGGSLTDMTEKVIKKCRRVR